MTNQTVLIIVAFVVIWLVLFIIFMLINKRRKEKAQSFIENNKDMALVHLYCRNTKINGRDISEFNPTTGENLQKIVALPSGEYSFEGIFETTDIRLGKTINLKTDKIEFNLDVQAGRSYTVAMYLNSSTETAANPATDILTIPLTLYEGSDNIKAFVICYREG